MEAFRVVSREEAQETQERSWPLNTSSFLTLIVQLNVRVLILCFLCLFVADC